MSFDFSHPVPASGQALVQNLVGWQIREVPKGKWSFFGYIERNEVVEAIFISGDASGQTKLFEGVSSCAAMDVILKEPKLLLGEPPTNIYHYAFETEKDGTLKKWGASKDQTILGHWPHGKTTPQVVCYYRRLSDGEL